MGLVVDGHHRNQQGLVVYRPGDSLGCYHAVSVGLDLDHLEALVREPLSRLEHAAVLDSRDHKAVPSASVGISRAEEREVVRLGASAREGELLGSRAETARDGLSRVRKLVLGVYSPAVERGGIPVAFGHHPKRLISRRAAYARGRAVV